MECFSDLPDSLHFSFSAFILSSSLLFSFYLLPLLQPLYPNAILLGYPCLLFSLTPPISLYSLW